MTETERHAYDVVVIGAGGAGPARRHRGPRAGQADGDHLQVAVRQGAHGDGRGRHRRVDGQRELQRQLAGALPRHHARRQVPQPLADGRAAREGGARPGLGARDLGRPVRPHQGRPDQPAQLRRPRVPAPRARRRPHRARADPHAAAEDRLAAAGGRARARRPRGAPQRLRRVHDHPAAHRRRPHRRRVRLLARVRPLRHLRGAGRRARDRRHRQVVQGDQQLVGVHRRRPRAGAAGRRDAASTWSSSSSTPPAWSGRRASRGSSSPSRCAATGAS